MQLAQGSRKEGETKKPEGGGKHDIPLSSSNMDKNGNNNNNNNNKPPKRPRTIRYLELHGNAERGTDREEWDGVMLAGLAVDWLWTGWAELAAGIKQALARHWQQAGMNGE